MLIVLLVQIWQEHFTYKNKEETEWFKRHSFNNSQEEQSQIPREKREEEFTFEDQDLLFLLYSKNKYLYLHSSVQF